MDISDYTVFLRATARLAARDGVTMAQWLVACAEAWQQKAPKEPRSPEGARRVEEER